MIDDPALWEVSWSQLMRRFEDLADRSLERNPRVHWSYGHRVGVNEYFPFRGYASAMRRRQPDADEDLVISIDCHCPGGTQATHAILSADIDSQGLADLVEGPKTIITLSAPPGVVEQEVTSWTEDVDRWLDENAELIASHLA